MPLDMPPWAWRARQIKASYSSGWPLRRSKVSPSRCSRAAAEAWPGRVRQLPGHFLPEVGVATAAPARGFLFEEFGDARSGHVGRSCLSETKSMPDWQGRMGGVDCRGLSFRTRCSSDAQLMLPCLHGRFSVPGPRARECMASGGIHDEYVDPDASMASLSSCRTAAFCFPISTKPSTPGTPGWWDATASASRCSRACSPDAQPSSGSVRRQGRVRYRAAARTGRLPDRRRSGRRPPMAGGAGADRGG